jgi:hypothetical protein
MQRRRTGRCRLRAFCTKQLELEVILGRDLKAEQERSGSPSSRADGGSVKEKHKEQLMLGRAIRLYPEKRVEPRECDASLEEFQR